MIGNVYFYVLKDRTQAQKYWREGLKIDPNYKNIKNELEKYEK